MSGMVAELGSKIMGLGKRQAHLQLATKRDIGKILELYYAEGWIDYSYDEIEYLFDAFPHGCFKVTLDDKLIGVNFATPVGDGICFPHSNLLATEYRSKVNYFDEAVKYNEYLKSLSQLDILYAAKKVIRVYAAGGFKSLNYYRRAAIDVGAIDKSQITARQAMDDDWVPIWHLCRTVYKSNRQNLTRYFTGRGLAKAFVVDGTDGAVSAFAMVRKLPKYHMIGPVLANSEEAAAQVIAAAACSQPDASVMIEGDEGKLSFLLPKYFSSQWEPNTMLKMYRGDSSLLEDESRLYAIFARYTS